MQEMVTAWYVFLSGLSAWASAPLRGVGDAIGLPIISALLFGLIGAASPCQLTTTAGAVAFLSQGSDGDGHYVGRAGAYLLGKMLVYTIAGAVVILAGMQLAQTALPVVALARRLVGPMMLLLGVSLLGVLPLRFVAGARGSAWLKKRAGTGVRGAFLLGVALAFAFCPTLFLLFFGLTIPLALRSPLGLAYPASFAVGTTLPLLTIMAVLTLRGGSARGGLLRARRITGRVQPIAALVLILLGLNDTLVYWFL